MAGAVIENGVPDFFARIAALPAGQGAARAFDRILRSGLVSSLPGWHAKLFRRLIAFVLREFHLPASPGAESWEWAPLFRVEQEVDPHYFGQRELAERLGACPPMPAETRHAVLGILDRYFAWRREPMLIPSPYPLLSKEETLRWAAVFPREQAWRSLNILREAGIYPLGGAAGYRAWRRFTQGDFDAPLTIESLSEWGAACHVNGSETETHRRDFAAGAFAGDWPAFGLEGICGEVPECPACPLRGECAWAAGERREQAGSAEARAWLRREGASNAPAEHLMQAVFGLDARQTGAWRERLENTSMRSLAARSLSDLADWQGDLPPEPERLQALFELARRFSEERLLPGAVFRGGEDVFKHFRVRLRDAKQEHFYLLLLDTRHRFQSEVAISQGTIENALVHPRDVFGAAVRERAGAVVVVHNHPSGDPTPSPEDINVTQRLAEAGALLGIPLLDHVIVGEGRFVSFVERGLLGKP